MTEPNPLIKLARGQPYPLPLATREGASAQFLVRSGSFLQVVLPDMIAKEERALRAGLLKAGLLAKNGAMLWLFQFLDDKGQPVITLDAPYDVRLLKPESRELPNIESSQQRLFFEVHAVDEKGILRGLRGITLPPELTLQFFSAVQDQLASAQSGEAQHAEWMRHEPVELIRQAKLWVCGQ